MEVGSRLLICHHTLFACNGYSAKQHNSPGRVNKTPNKGIEINSDPRKLNNKCKVDRRSTNPGETGISGCLRHSKAVSDLLGRILSAGKVVKSGLSKQSCDRFASPTNGAIPTKNLAQIIPQQQTTITPSHPQQSITTEAPRGLHSKMSQNY